jgi:hypothetical protein
MKMPAGIVVLLLPLLLVGCTPKDKSKIQALAPPIEDSPLPKPSNAPADLPPPVVTVPPPPPAPNPNTNAQTQPPPKPPAKHRKPQAVPTQPTQQAATEDPGVSAIGQLSSGASDLRQQTSESIAATEHGLTGITRALSEPEQKTAAQIKEWLKQARALLDSGDVDGAHTLAAKAKALLTELNQ